MRLLLVLRSALLPALLCALLAWSHAATAESPASALAVTSQLVPILDQLTACQPGLATQDGQAVANARAALQAWDTAWVSVEQTIKADDRDAYAAIESAAADLRFQLDPVDGDPRAAAAVVDQLAHTYRSWSARSVTTTPAAPTAPLATTEADDGTAYAVVTATANRAWRSLQAGDDAVARRELDEVRRRWPDVEGRVVLRDHAAYRTIEALQAQAAAFLGRGDRPRAELALAELVVQLDRFRAVRSVTWFDAWLIIMREGLEALLVVAALLAWLRGSESPAQMSARRLVWLGAGSGLLVSIVIAIAAHLLFGQLVSGIHRELVEGVVGLAAAILMVWVAWWLHRQTAMAGWADWLRERTRLLASGGRLSALALLAFLAVLREGAETALFLIALGPTLPGRELAIGLGAGAASLLFVGVVGLGFGMRLPIVPLLRTLTILLALLALKFVGAGIGALQIAQVLPSTPLAWWPDLPIAGFFPTSEALLAQAVVASVLLLLTVHTSLANRALRAAKSL